MAKSQQTFNKKEREKKQRKKRQDKIERREQRKLEKEETGKKSLEEQFMYVDEDGNLTPTPPDPAKRKQIRAEDISLDNRPQFDASQVKERTGTVKFFNQEKGFGFIVDAHTDESIFVHTSNVSDAIKENDRVSFILDMGPKGAVATQVKLLRS